MIDIIRKVNKEMNNKKVCEKTIKAFFSNKGKARVDVQGKKAYFTDEGKVLYIVPEEYFPFDLKTLTSRLLSMDGAYIVESSDKHAVYKAVMDGFYNRKENGKDVSIVKFTACDDKNKSTFVDRCLLNDIDYMNDDVYIGDRRLDNIVFKKDGEVEAICCPVAVSNENVSHKIKDFVI